MKKILFHIIIIFLSIFMISGETVKFNNEIKLYQGSYTTGIIIVNNSDIYNNFKEKKVISNIEINSIVKIVKLNVEWKNQKSSFWYMINYNNITGWIKEDNILPILKNNDNIIIGVEERVKNSYPSPVDSNDIIHDYYRNVAVYDINEKKIIQKLDINFKEYGYINIWLSDASFFKINNFKDYILIEFSYLNSFGYPKGFRGSIIYKMNHDGTLVKYFHWYNLIQDEPGLGIQYMDIENDKIKLFYKGIYIDFNTLELEYIVDKDVIKLNKNKCFIDGKKEIDVDELNFCFEKLPTNISFIYDDNNKEKVVINIKNYSPSVNSLRLRETPDLNGKFIRTLIKGEKLEKLDMGKSETVNGVKGNWVKVKTEKGEIGWCFDAYLEKVKTDEVKKN